MAILEDVRSRHKYVAAPGTDMVSTSFNSGYTAMTGTSMSAPAVSALAARILSANPILLPDEVAQILTSTASPIHPIHPNNYMRDQLILGLDGALVLFGVAAAFYAIALAGAYFVATTSNKYLTDGLLDRAKDVGKVSLLPGLLFVARQRQWRNM